MTYTVSGGMLNSIIPYHTLVLQVVYNYYPLLLLWFIYIEISIIFLQCRHNVLT